MIESLRGRCAGRPPVPLVLQRTFWSGGEQWKKEMIEGLRGRCAGRAPLLRFQETHSVQDVCWKTNKEGRGGGRGQRRGGEVEGGRGERRRHHDHIHCKTVKIRSIGSVTYILVVTHHKLHAIGMELIPCFCFSFLTLVIDLFWRSKAEGLQWP